MTSTEQAPAMERVGTERRGIYIASKTTHAQRWRILRDKVGYPIVSTWIDEAGAGESADLSDLWARCIAEASRAEVLVLYREPPEILKGGWIELGAALSCSVPVFAVGIGEFTVAHHSGIRHFPEMKDAMQVLKPMVNGVRFAELPGCSELISLRKPVEATAGAVQPTDPMMILAGIKQFGLAGDGADLRDLASAITALQARVAELERDLEHTTRAMMIGTETLRQMNRAEAAEVRVAELEQDVRDAEDRTDAAVSDYNELITRIDAAEQGLATIRKETVEEAIAAPVPAPTFTHSTTVAGWNLALDAKAAAIRSLAAKEPTP